MQNSLHKLIQIILLILGLITLSPAMDEEPSDEYCEISLNVEYSIAEQQESFRPSIKIPQREITPEEIIYDIPKELQPPENIYHFSDEKSPWGFFCGRCQFMFYDGHHPNHDCCRLPYYFPLRIANEDCCAKGLSGLLYNLVLNGFFGFLPSLYLTGAFYDLTISGFLPLVVTGSLSCYLTTHCLLVEVSYKYAEYIGDQDFLDSFRSGQLCLPEDPCSCTSCFGVNFYKYNKKYCCCGSRK